MRVLWTHNFDPGIPNNLVYIDTTAEAIRVRGVDLQIEYLGNLRSIPQLFRARARVRRLAPEFDLVHAQYGSVCALATAAAEGVPKVLTVRGSDWNTYKSSFGISYLHTWLASRFTRAAIGSYDYVVSVSRRVAAGLARFAPDAHMTVLPSPIDLARFVPRNRREAKALLGHPDCSEKWVLFNALSLENPIKRFDLAKQAFEIAQARHGNLRLRLATGLPHDVLPLFTASCDLIVCTSENEGWPNSVKEALACNVPFVATDVSDLRDIARNEPSCRICHPDAQVIADNICDVLAGPEPRGLRQHVLGMSLDAVGEQLISAYESVLERYRRSDRLRSAN
jgi:glycosyltransferase involved in cell wall biosynthesis